MFKNEESENYIFNGVNLLLNECFDFIMLLYFLVWKWNLFSLKELLVRLNWFILERIMFVFFILKVVVNFGKNI